MEPMYASILTMREKMEVEPEEFYHRGRGLPSGIAHSIPLEQAQAMLFTDMERGMAPPSV